MDEHEATMLVDRRVIVVPQGAFRGRELTRGGVSLGWAEQGRLYGLDHRYIADARHRKGPEGFRVWVVEDADGREVGSLVPTTRVGWRGKVKPATGSLPHSWTGSVRLAGSHREVADIRGGAVVHADGRLVAEVLLGEKRWFGTQSMWGEWTLKFHDCPDPRLRLMCFGWLNVAWQLQRQHDTSD